MEKKEEEKKNDYIRWVPRKRMAKWKPANDSPARSPSELNANSQVFRFNSFKSRRERRRRRRREKSIDQKESNFQNGFFGSLLRKKYMRSRYSRWKDMIKYTRSNIILIKTNSQQGGLYHSLNRGEIKKFRLGHNLE